MSAREVVDDRDWWTPHVLVSAFCVLVAAILCAVPGWSAPLHGWVTLAAFVIGALACHAAVRAAASGWRRQWRTALRGLVLAAGLGVAAVGLLAFGHWVGLAGSESIFVDSLGAVR